MNEIVDRLVQRVDEINAKYAEHSDLYLFGKRDSRYLRGVAAKAKKFGIAVRWQDIYPPAVINVPFVIDWESFGGDTRTVEPRTPWHDIDAVCDTTRMSCTASACGMILREYGAIDHNHVGIIGRGHAVQGLGESLVHNNATLTVCHSKTPNIVGAVMNCDVLVNAAPRVDVMYIPPFGKHLILDVSGSMKDMFSDVPATTYVGMQDIGRLNTSILINRFLAVGVSHDT